MPADLVAKYESEKKAKSWLVEEGYELVEVEIRGDPRITWAFGVIFSPTAGDTVQKKVPVVLVGREGQSRVDAVLEANLSKEHQDLLGSDGIVARNVTRTIRERIFLHGTGLSFQKNEEGRVVSIRLDEVAYTDAPFSKDRLMTMLRRLYNVFLYASDVLTYAKQASLEDTGVGR